jgi:hypothetical protein
MSAELDKCHWLRGQVKEVAEQVSKCRRTVSGEAAANITIAYRHLEDASMRLGKAVQALDGGVSVYDKFETVMG